MPSFSMDDLKKAVYGNAFNALELTPKTGGEVNRMVGRRGKRSLAESETLIKNFILGAEEPVTMLQICDHIGRAPAPHFRAIVNNLIEAGLVKRFDGVSEGGNLPRYLYWRAGR